MRLPSLNALRAFEAAARHNGYAAAAEELCVTRGAISRHVKLLEEELGVQLFKRMPRGIELTASGRNFLPVLTEAFSHIADGATRLSADQTELRIICPPTISIRWLIPRLGSFRARHPDIRVRLTTEFYGANGFDATNFDLGFSVENFPGRPSDVPVLPLFPMILSPACSPTLMTAENQIKTPDDLAGFTLLHESSDRTDWTTWIRTFGARNLDPSTGDVFPNLDMAVKAAVMGAGIVMGDIVLCRDEFETQTLIMPFKDMQCETSWGRFCLIGSKANWTDPKVEVFKAWAAETSASEAAELPHLKAAR